MSKSTFDLSFDRIKASDLSAYETVFKSYYAPLVQYANKIVRDRTVSEEIAQEVLLYIWEKRERINITGALDSYLFAAAKNKCINWLKYELPKIQASVDIADVELSSWAGEVDPENERLVKRIIDNAIASLPQKCREIFVLSRFGGLTYEEIAEDKALSIKTVENQMGIALKKLRQQLQPLLNRTSND